MRTALQNASQREEGLAATLQRSEARADQMSAQVCAIYAKFRCDIHGRGAVGHGEGRVRGIALYVREDGV